MQIARAAQRLAKGDFSARIDMQTGDERDQVIKAFNRMGPRLEDHLRIRQALDLAQQVQQNLLPRTTPEVFGLDIAGSSIYCDETGGDYYDFFKIGSKEQSRLAVIVGDVAGHGISSALLMATARALLRQRAAMPGETTQILSDVNRQLSFDTSHTSQFMTLFYSEFDPDNRVIHWIRAGHDPAIVYNQRTDTFEELKGRGMALGLDESFQFTECQRHLSSGEIFLIGTDGIWEMHNDQGSMFGKDKLRQVIRKNAGLTAAEIQGAITHALNRFKGSRPPEDDVTMVIVKVL